MRTPVCQHARIGRLSCCTVGGNMLIDVSTPLPREFCRQHRRHDRWIAKQEDQLLYNKYQANADQPAVLIVTTNQDDYIYNNQFVACLCQGQTASTAALGNSTISASASTCSTCATTPSLIVQNINVGVIAGMKGIPSLPEVFVHLLTVPCRISLTYVLSKLRMEQPAGH